MENSKIRIGITHGDINGVGYEVILKAFADPTMLELCTPIVYGSPKVAAYHRKAMDLTTNFTIINSAAEAADDKLNILNCTDDEVKVEFSKPTQEAGRAALDALEKAMADYREGLIDVIVTAPINKNTIQSDDFHFPGHTEYIEQRLGDGNKALMILMNDTLRVALVTGHMPVSQIAEHVTKEAIEEKLRIFNHSLKVDFGISSPRIAVLSLNPHAGDNGLLGTEENEIISPAISEMSAEGILCYGPYSSDGFMGSGNYTHFDGVLAMYHDQGLAPFKTLAMDNGVNYTAGLPVIRTSPDHGTAYDIAGKGLASEASFRQAIYVAIDVFRNRQRDAEAKAHPLRKQYYEKRDDSDKLKLDAVDDDEI
jgi:4-hydroxythreonine-4-phosphate dehydrogenase